MIPTPVYVQHDSWGDGWWLVFETELTEDAPYAFESYDARFVCPR